MCERVHAFLQKMAGRRVLVVSPGGTMWCLRYVLEGWSYEEASRRFNAEPMLNCAVTSYRVDESGKRLRLADAGRVWWR